MKTWTHLVRFIAVEDSQIHLGQLVDHSGDIGRDALEGKDSSVYLIDGTIFDGRVTDEIKHVKQLLSPVSKEECNYIRCLGLNYLEHAKVPFPYQYTNLNAPNLAKCISLIRKQTSPSPKLLSSSPIRGWPSQTHIQPRS